jgi:hypothetical protein
MKADIDIEHLPNHAPMAISVVRKEGRRPSPYIVRAVADFMREHGLEELEVYYGQEAVEGALKSETPGEGDPVELATEEGVPRQVEPEPVDEGVGVQPSEAELPAKPKGKRGKGKKGKGKSLID